MVTYLDSKGKPFADQDAAKERMVKMSRQYWQEMHQKYGLTTYQEIIAVFKFFDKVDFDLESLSTVIDQEQKSIILMIDSSDLFAWGYADRDPITPQDIPEMQRAYDDLKIAGSFSYVYWPQLFLSRKARRRVQYAQYQRIPEEAKYLFKEVSEEPGYGWPNEKPE